MENMKLLQAQMRAYEENIPYAMVTIVSASGSTRSKGKMLVYESGDVLGSVGGGAIEQLAIRDAKAAIASGEGGLRAYELDNQAAKDGVICSGSMQVLIEPYGVRPTLVLCGAGHVNMAVMPVAKNLGFRIILVDNRPESLIANAIAMADQFVPVTNFEEGIKVLDVAPGAYYVLAGPNHASDGSALAGVLTKNGKYVGMIGGAPKIKSIFSKLKDRGYTQEQLDAVHTPIGLDISNERPEEIAISIMAEILMVKNGKPRPTNI